jgi:hypothetical protein
MPTITSCVKDTNEVVPFSENEQAFAEMRDAITTINKATPNIQEIFQNNQISNRNNEYGITQELIDDFALEYGFEEGAITLDFVESIIEQKAIIDETGFEGYTYNVSYNNYTKEKLVRMSTGEIIEDLENDLDFQNLPLEEKNILLITKTFQEDISSFNTLNRNPSFQPEWSTEWFIVGMFSYQALIGFAAFAPIGAFAVAGLVAVLVYNIIGWLTK